MGALGSITNNGSTWINNEQWERLDLRCFDRIILSEQISASYLPKYLAQTIYVMPASYLIQIPSATVPSKSIHNSYQFWFRSISHPNWSRLQLSIMFECKSCIALHTHSACIAHQTGWARTWSTVQCFNLLAAVQPHCMFK